MCLLIDYGARSTHTLYAHTLLAFSTHTLYSHTLHSCRCTIRIISKGYSCLQESLVHEWRRLWSVEPGTTAADAPFGLVTLAPTGM
jgi:hypothetical protein